jgi:trans-2-enoyl-CoA reductase
MASRRYKPKSLGEFEVARFLQDATEMHLTITGTSAGSGSAARISMLFGSCTMR